MDGGSFEVAPAWGLILWTLFTLLVAAMVLYGLFCWTVNQHRARVRGRAAARAAQEDARSQQSPASP